jgi:hypothetical protein
MIAPLLLIFLDKRSLRTHIVAQRLGSHPWVHGLLVEPSDASIGPSTVGRNFETVARSPKVQ